MRRRSTLIPSTAAIRTNDKGQWAVAAISAAKAARECYRLNEIADGSGRIESVMGISRAEKT